MVGLALLLPAELPALGVRLQLAELLLVERFYRSLHWKNGVEVVAVPLQTALVKVSAMLHHDEVLSQEDANGLYHSVPRHSCGGGDGVVAGVAGVCFAILDQQKVGVHHERRRWKIQQEDFIGEGEKFSAASRQEISSEGTFFRDQSYVLQVRQVLPRRTRSCPRISLRCFHPADTLAPEWKVLAILFPGSMISDDGYSVVEVQSDREIKRYT